MQVPGLPFRQLKADQRALWLKINTTRGYSGLDMELGRAARMFSGWNRDSMEYQTVSGSRGTRVMLAIRYPGPESADGIEQFGLPSQDVDTEHVLQLKP